MKKILTLLFVSILGGAITLSAYKLLVEKDAPYFVSYNDSKPTFIPANNTVSNLLYNADAVDFTQAAENAIHTVVHVKNTTVSRGGPITLQDLFYGRGSERTQIGTGSGVIISPDGYIITNNHVINGARDLSITLNDNKIYSARLIGTDEKTDIALLKIEPDEELRYATFGDSDQAKVGEWVLAVGNPFNLTSTVTAGIISAKSRDLSGTNAQSFLQTDAAVNPGNSGGALVNIYGDLIGINTAITSQTGSYIGYSFAVPSNIARKVVEDIIEFGDVQTGILGVNILNKNSEYAVKNGINEIEGLYVSDIEDNSGADKAGIKNGDIIKKIDNIKISKFSDLSGYLNTKRPKDVVNVIIERNGKEIEVPVTLSKSEIMTVEFLDMQLKNLTKLEKEKYNIENGVLVVKNENYALYKNLGINQGYIITDINDEKIKSIDDITKIQQKYGDKISKISVINTKGQKESFIFR